MRGLKLENFLMIKVELLNKAESYNVENENDDMEFIKKKFTLIRKLKTAFLESKQYQIQPTLVI